MAPSPETQRQALIAVADQLSDLILSATADGSISFDAAIAIVAGALVQAGPSSYRPGSLAALSLTPQGRVRVTLEELAIDRFAGPPSVGALPWDLGGVCG